jgi:copper transport protein
VATVAIVAVFVTGFLLTGREVATVTALLTSWFGRLLLLKLVVVVIVAVIGLDHALSVRRGKRLNRRSLQLEAGLALVIIVGGAALSTTQPAVGAFYAPPVLPSPGAPAVNIDDVIVKLSIRPNRPGASLATATVASNRRPEPAPITGVTLDFRPLAVEGVEPIVVKGPAPVNGIVDFGQIQLPVAGAYQVEVQVDRPEAPLGLAIVQWTVDPPQPPRAKTFVSDARLAPVANAAAVVAALVGLAVVVRGWRRRPPSPPDDDDEGDGAQVVGSQAGRADS